MEPLATAFAKQGHVTQLIKPVVLNISPYLPNQIILAATCFVVSTFLFVYAVFDRSSVFWFSTMIRLAAILNLVMWVFMAAFIAAGLTSPLVQPYLNLFSEAAIIAAFSVVCLQVCGKGLQKGGSLELVVSRRWLTSIFKTAPWVLGAGLLVSAVMAFYNPFPMTGVWIDLPMSALIYREAYLTPEAFYTLLLSLAYSTTLVQHIRSRHEDREYRTILFWLTGGSLAWFGLCCVHWTFSYLQVRQLNLLANPGVFWPLVVFDIMLYFAMGLCWIAGLNLQYRESPTQKYMDDFEEYRLIRLHLREYLSNLKERKHPWEDVEQAALRTAERLGLQDFQHRCGRAFLESCYLANHGVSRQKMGILYNKYCSVAKGPQLYQNCRSKDSVKEDSLPPVLPVVLSLFEGPSGEMVDLRREPEGYQVGAVVAADQGLLPPAQAEAILEGEAVCNSVLLAYEKER